MKTDIQIIPAILATTEEEYEQKLKKIEVCPELAEGWIQIDLMDNKFVQNSSINPEIVFKYPTSLKRELQLMVEKPWSEWLVKLDLNQSNRIIAPIEVEEIEIREMLATLGGTEIQFGLSLNPETPVKILEEYITGLDTVLIMSVDPGFSGQQFKPEVLGKIKQLKSLRSDLVIGVDGGISAENVKLIVEAGADYLVIGSHLVDGDITENLEKIWARLRG